MPPWTILEDFDEVPEAKSPFSTRAVLSPRLAASSATPAPVTPPPMTSTSNSSSARRRSASSRRNGCIGPACHIRLRIDPGCSVPMGPVPVLVSCRRGSRHGAGPWGSGAAWRALSPRPANCRVRGSDRRPGETTRGCRRRRASRGRRAARRRDAGRRWCASPPRWRPSRRTYLARAATPLSVRRMTLPRVAAGSGSTTAQARRSRNPVHMALPSLETPVRRGRSRQASRGAVEHAQRVGTDGKRQPRLGFEVDREGEQHPGQQRDQVGRAPGHRVAG